MKQVVLFLLIPFLGYTQNFEQGVDWFQQKKIDQAKAVFSSITPSDSNYHKAIEYLADIAAYKKDWDTSLQYYKQLLDKDEQNATYHYKYGGALALKARASNKLKALGMIGDFKKHLHKAAELDKNHIDVRWALVEIYISLPGIVGGSEEKAIYYAKELMELSPVDGYLSLGYVAEYNNRPQDAEMYYKEAIKVGGSLHTYTQLSELYEKTEQPQKALESYEATQSVYKRNHLNYQVGKVCAQYNMHLDKGLGCLKAYIKNHSPNDGVPISWAKYRIAQIYRHKNDKRNAYNFIQSALKELPSLEAAKKEKELILLMK